MITAPDLGGAGVAFDLAMRKVDGFDSTVAQRLSHTGLTWMRSQSGVTFARTLSTARRTSRAVTDQIELFRV